MLELKLRLTAQHQPLSPPFVQTGRHRLNSLMFRDTYRAVFFGFRGVLQPQNLSITPRSLQVMRVGRQLLVALQSHTLIFPQMERQKH